jgi:hypothetical protein
VRVDRSAGAGVVADVGDQRLGTLDLVGEHEHGGGVADDRRSGGVCGDEAPAVEAAIDQLAPAARIRARLGQPRALEDQQRIARRAGRDSELVQRRQSRRDLTDEPAVDRGGRDPDGLERRPQGG